MVVLKGHRPDRLKPAVGMPEWITDGCRGPRDLARAGMGSPWARDMNSYELRNADTNSITRSRFDGAGYIILNLSLLVHKFSVNHQYNVI
jgi:hypothetical protein